MAHGLRTYTCDDATLVPDSVSRTCQVDGSWSGSAPTQRLAAANDTQTVEDPDTSGGGIWVQWTGLTCVSPTVTVRIRRSDMDQAHEYITVQANGNNFGPRANGQYWGGNAAIGGGVAGAAASPSATAASQTVCASLESNEVFVDADASQYVSTGSLRIHVIGPSDIGNFCSGYGASSGDITLSGCAHTGVTSGHD